MWIGAIFALILAGCLAVEPNRVASLTRQFVEELKALNPTGLQDFYDEDAVFSLDKTFGFGGDFEGPEGVEVFLTRMLPEVVNQPPQVQILGVDEARAASLLKMDLSGTFARTGKNFNSSVLHILEWNPVDGKIITHVVLMLNPGQTFAAYQTDAEKHFEKLLWTLFRSSYKQLTDINSPLWQLISDNIQVKINGYPEDLLTKMEWHGKDEVLKGFKEMEDLKRNMPIYKQLLTRTNLIDAKVLLSTDTDAWVRWGYRPDEDKDDVITQAVVHYVFDKDGKLVNEEITFAYAARPWVVYPFPAPKQPEIDEKQVRKLMMTRNMLAQQSSIVQQQPSNFEKQAPADAIDQSQSRPFGSSQSVVPEQKVPEVEQKWVFTEQQPVEQDYGLGERVETPKVAQQVTEPQAKPIVQKKVLPSQQQAKPVVGENQVKSVYEFGRRGEQVDSKPNEPVMFEDLKQIEGKKQDKEKEVKEKQDEEEGDKEDKEKDEEEHGNDEKEGEDKEEDETDLPAFIHVDGDINTRIKPGFEGKFGTMPPMDVEVHGDMKTSIVTFGSGKVDSVRFVGSIDELEIEKPRLHLVHGPEKELHHD